MKIKLLITYSLAVFHDSDDQTNEHEGEQDEVDYLDHGVGLEKVLIRDVEGNRENVLLTLPSRKARRRSTTRAGPLGFWWPLQKTGICSLLFQTEL